MLFYTCTLSLNTQPRTVRNALQNLSKDMTTAKLLRRTEQGSTTRKSAVSILYVCVFHVGDLPWLFLLRSCVSTHVFFPAFFRCLFFQHAGGNAGKYVCVHLYKFFIDALIYVLCFDYVGLLLMMNMLTIVVSHVTCIIPQIWPKAYLSTQERAEKWSASDNREAETIFNWRSYWPQRQDNKGFTKGVILAICKKEGVPARMSQSRDALVKALNSHFNLPSSSSSSSDNAGSTVHWLNRPQQRIEL